MALRWLSFLVAGVLMAQQTSVPAFRSDTDLVVCHTTVRDQKERPVLDLKRDAFTVLENGQPQTVTVFVHEDMPVSMGLVIDNSARMSDKRARVIAAALSLVNESNPADEVFVVNFNEEPYLDLPRGEDFTSNRAEIEQALSRVDARGASCVRYAVAKSLEHLEQKAHCQKKVLVIVTNGKDSASAITQQELLRQARQSDAVIYVVGLLNRANCGEHLVATRRALRELAEATGGEAFFPKGIDQVERIAHLIARSIRDQYVLAYRPSDGAASAEFREIKILVNSDPRLTVRTRSGYYVSALRTTQ